MKTNFRVVIYPRRIGDYGYVSVRDDFFNTKEQVEKGYQERCEHIMDDIKRHVDYVGDIEILWDEEDA